jgi:hypothetical protein
MSKELTEAQKIARLRSNLATKAAHTIKNKYLDEFQEVYYGLLNKHGLQPTSKTMHMQKLAEENKKLKELLKQQGHEWNYPKPKEQTGEQ